MKAPALSLTLVPVGAGGLVSAERIVAAGRHDSAPIRRAVRRARNEGRLIDLTFGHACHWVLFLDTGHLVLAPENFQHLPNTG